MDVPVELSRVLITEYGDQQIIVLKEKNGPRSFPIQIGTHEAVAIHRRLHNKRAPRPMTHDLLANVIDALGGKIEKIVINDLRDHTFIATLHIRQADRVIPVDSRPSDAIALGSAFDTPVFVAQHVFDEVTKQPSMAEKLELLRKRGEILADQIEQLEQRLSDERFLRDAPDSLIEQQRQRLEEMRTELQAIEQLLEKFQ